MINPQKGIDLMNNTSIINRILFAVTIFQHSPLTRRVFYNNIRRERGQHHHQHLGTLTGVSINHRKFFSSSITETTQHKSWSIINISTRLRVFSTRLATQYHQHEAGITVRYWKHIIINMKLASHHEVGNTSSSAKLASHHETGNTSSQHEAGTSS
jgi:hypothetical protein